MEGNLIHTQTSFEIAGINLTFQLIGLDMQMEYTNVIFAL